MQSAKPYPTSEFLRTVLLMGDSAGKRGVVDDDPDVEVSFCDDQGRPKIDKYTTVPKFRPNDQVYIRLAGTSAREGPYIVSSVNGGKYTLCDRSGNPLQSGRVFDERELELRDPFE